jgi:hypothetical protein
MTTNVQLVQPSSSDVILASQPPLDPFDVNALRLDQSFVETAGVKKLLTTVPVRKPHKQDFVRVHPDPDYRAQFALIEVRDDREVYLLTPDIARQLPGEYAMATPLYGDKPPGRRPPVASAIATT